MALEKLREAARLIQECIQDYSKEEKEEKEGEAPEKSEKSSDKKEDSSYSRSGMFE